MRAIILKTFAVMALILATTAGAQAQTWDCGATQGTVTCIVSDGIFTVSGTGAMMDIMNRDYDHSITSVVIEDGVTSIGGRTFWRCTSLTSVTIPGGVTSIVESAFESCSSLTSVTIGDGVTSIGERAFESCSNLTSVTIPDGVTSIGERAFRRCTGLTSVMIGNGVTSIGKYAFYYCTSLTSVTIGNSVTSIGDVAFYGCSGLTSITIPNSVTSIGEGAFSSCQNLTSVTIGNSVTSIGESAFSNCQNLTSVTIPNSVTSIGRAAFIGCSGLTSMTIPNSVTSIGHYTFGGCSNLTSVTIPNSVTSIGYGTFWECTGLTSVTIGNSVDSIAEAAFYKCANLVSIISLREIPPKMVGNTFLDVRGVACLYVPVNSIEAYSTAGGWNYPIRCIKSLEEYVSVLTPNRVIPQTKPTEEATVIAPMVILVGEFTAGPNPVLKESGIVNFYRQGKRVANCELRVYDATGNVINKVKIRDNVIGSQAKRQVGSWNLTDKNGRQVSEGAYLVKGVLKTSGGKGEKVSVILGVR